MSKIKTYIKRCVHYILHGIPRYEIKVNTAQPHLGNILEGKHILITGGSRGLGYYMAKRAIEEKATVTITGRNMNTLQQAAKKMGSPQNLYLIEHDVSKTLEHDQVIQKAICLMGKVDILVNNAGISVHDITYATCSEQQWDSQMNTNLKGVFFMTQAFLKYYEHNECKQGKIINIVSERGLYGDDVPYGMAKRALISYTEGLAVRLIQKGIRVNAIAPGVTATEMTGYDPNGDLLRPWALGKRVFLPEEIAEVALFLFSDASNCISGQVIACNEGNHLK